MARAKRGRPAKPPDEKWVKVSIKLEPELVAELERLMRRRPAATFSDTVRSTITRGLAASSS